MHRIAKLALYGLVIAGLVGGTVAWASADKSVSVAIDGRSRTVRTMARTVAAVLHDARIDVHAHDALAPSPGTPIADHGRITLLRGRLLHLEVDGRRRDVWTTASTVDEALAQLGYGREALQGVSRSSRLPLTPTELALITPKRIVVTADRRNRTVVTTEATVGSLLASLHIRLGASDRVSAPIAAMLVDDEHLVVQRVRYTSSTKQLPVPYGTKTTDDPTVYQGATTVLVAGKDGVREQTTQYIYVDGTLAGTRLVADRILTPPTTQQQKVGTRPGPPTPDDAQAIARTQLYARGWDDTQFQCLFQLWGRESGWRVNAYNPSGAYGIPQALPGSKMASAGADWQTNPATQIAWGLGYIAARYGDPCGAWSNEESQGNY